MSTTTRWDRIVPALRKLVDSHAYPGFAVLVWRRGEIVYEEVTGLADIEGRRPFLKDAIVRMYSQTKPVACAALLMLLEEGRYLLDDPVSRYLPSFGKVKVCAGLTGSGGMRLVDPLRPMAIRHLFTHTSGLSYGFDQANPVDRLYGQPQLLDMLTYGQMPLPKMMERLAEIPLVTHPGEVYRYSMSHDVVGYLVSVLADMPFDEYLQKRVFDPLGMEDTAFWVAPAKTGRFAAVYGTGQDGRMALAEPSTASVLLKPPVAALGGMGLVSTQRDYLRFARMLLNGGELEGVRLLSRKSVELMRSNHLGPAQLASMGSVEAPNHAWGYGLGVGVLMDRGLAGVLRSNGSFGWGGAAGTDVVIDPQEDLVVLSATQRLDAPYPHSALIQNLVYQALE